MNRFPHLDSGFLLFCRISRYLWIWCSQVTQKSKYIYFLEGGMRMEVVNIKKFTDRLFENVQPIWEKNHQHPFVQELGKGTLDVEKFIYYMKQDYVYLIDYAKLFAVGVVKANDLETMG